VKTTEAGGPRGGACPWAGPWPDPGGAGKKIKGRKRHALVDTDGRGLELQVHAASVQDRDGGVLVLSTSCGTYPFLRKLFADGGYQGPQFRTAVAAILPHLSIEIVKRSDQAKGFKVLPNRRGAHPPCADPAHAAKAM
jgi:transposase